MNGRTLRGIVATTLIGAIAATPLDAQSRSVHIESLPWTDAVKLLDTSTVVMIPLGAQSKEHGPHLPLNNDWLLAEYFSATVAAATTVVVYPTVNYSFYPAFTEYPGSTSLRLETARDMIVDIVRSIARHGPRRFYVLNTGVSTLRSLAPARDSLAASGIVMVYTDILKVGKDAEDRVRQQAGGTHADEIETSMMLYMHPDVVKMRLAPDDYHPGAGGLTRDSAAAVRDGKTWSRTGTFGNATLATREKGRVLVTAQVQGMLAEIAALRQVPIPVAPGPRTATVASGDSAMIVSASPYATRAGLAVLRAGGNAVDAAVTVALTLAVTYPAAGNIGGGGFMVARINGKNVALDFREIAPHAASRDMYLDAAHNVTGRSLTGALAAGVPGSVAGLYEAHRKYGTIPWAKLVQPAIELAENGFPIDSAFSDDDEEGAHRLSGDSASAALFLRDGRFRAIADTWRAPELAAVLRRIAEHGRDGFYAGPTAELIAAAMRRDHGIITLADLTAYQPIWRAPITFDYRGRHVVSMPPVSSGGLTLGLILGILEGRDVAALGWRTPQSIHLLAEAERRAYARRNATLGDPAFVTIPVASFMSKDTAATLRAQIGDRSSGGSVSPAAKEPRHTTHFSVVDAHGNAVAITTTLNESYGAAFTVPGGQFLLNDEMDDFTAKVGAVNAMGLTQGATNAIAPGKRMLSSMTPTIVLDSTNRVVLVTGAAGGAYIITAVAHQIVSLFDYHRTLAEAMAAPQFHHQDVPDSLVVEAGAWADSAVAFMKPLGHAVKRSPWGFLANVQSIHWEGGHWSGVTEPRGRGLAAGY